jgi:pyridoxal phosphate enzyme (YggS family)
VRNFGESYLQEALEKRAAVGDLELTWHFIGRLQANKTRPIAESFAWVHGVDRLKIAERLSEQRPYYAPVLNVCLQVNVAGEESKGGVSLAELPALAAAVAGLPRLKLRGLMCIAPEEDDPARQRGWFAKVRQALEALNETGMGLDTLSMGMSGDLEAAILEGATLVRVGTALFGPRSLPG